MEKKDKKIKKETEVKASTNKCRLTGVVVSDKMEDTIVVKVQSLKKHPKYQKFMSSSKKYKAHDAGNTRKIGDNVTIEECAPISKDKSFIVIG